MSNICKKILSVIGLAVSAVSLVICADLAEKGVIDSVLATLLVTVCVVFLVVSICFATKLDYETGVYQCRNCGHIFKPTFKAYIWGSHSMTTRYLKCPKCDEKSWCKRIADTEKTA